MPHASFTPKAKLQKDQTASGTSSMPPRPDFVPPRPDFPKFPEDFDVEDGDDQHGHDPDDAAVQDVVEAPHRVLVRVVAYGDSW